MPDPMTNVEAYFDALERNRRTVDSPASGGLSRTERMILSTLLKVEEATSTSLMTDLDVGASEFGTALNSLRARGIVDVAGTGTHETVRLSPVQAAAL